MSQDDIAEKLELDRTTVSRIERGESPYDQDYLERLALVLGCDSDDLLAIDPLKPDGPKLIYSKLRTASPEMQKRVIEVIEALLKAG
jgi:transcriptional regulator with XRE-family HTH domain